MVLGCLASGFRVPGFRVLQGLGFISSVMISGVALGGDAVEDRFMGQEAAMWDVGLGWWMMMLMPWSVCSHREAGKEPERGEDILVRYSSSLQYFLYRCCLLGLLVWGRV